MTSTSKHAYVLGALTAGFFAASSAQAALDTIYNPGDLLLGFRQGTGGTATQNVVVNLGPASTYRDATGDVLNIANIGSILSVTYGNSWFDSTILNFGLVAANNAQNIDNSGSVAPGVDPNSTVYLSARRTALGTPRTPNPTNGSGRPGNTIPLDGQVQSAAVKIGDLGATFLATDTNQDGIALIGTTVQNGWQVNTTGSTQADFELFNIERAFTAGSLGTFGNAGAVENLLDFYRLPEFIGGNAPGTDGVGAFLGTFAIDSTGTISFVSATAATAPIPESSALLFAAPTMLGLALRRFRTRAVVA